MKNSDSLSPESRLTTVYTVNDSVQAEIIKNMLVDHDIPCEIGGEHQAGFTGTLSIEIIVRETDALRATKIIDAHLEHD